MKEIRDYVPEGQFRPHRPRSGARADAYDALVDGLLGYERRIRFPAGVAMHDVDGLLDLVKIDVPELFYVGPGNVMCVGSQEHPLSLTLYPTYRLGEKDAIALLDAMGREAEELVRRADELDMLHPCLPGVRCGLDPFDMLLPIHDWLVRRFSYEDAGQPHAHEAPGPLVYGRGVCEGVAKAMKYLCDRCRVACAVVSGTARDSADGSTGPHAWNLVHAGPGGTGYWTNADVTFDAALSHGFVRHDYFGRSDAELSGSHRRDEPSPLPLGDGSLRYYERESLMATSASRLGKIVDWHLPRAGGVEFVMPSLWEGRSELDAAVHHGVGKSAELMARGGAYTLYPNYDLLVFGLEVAS